MKIRTKRIVTATMSGVESEVLWELLRRYLEGRLNGGASTFMFDRLGGDDEGRLERMYDTLSTEMNRR